MRYEKSVSRIENDVENEEIQSVANPSGSTTLHCFNSRCISPPACFHLQTPKQNAGTTKIDDTIDSECFKQHAFRHPRQQQRRCSVDRYPAQRDVRQGE